mmetsp:Transcript_80568/g.207367  ORF Transcript_80568/g.207367 Transcript_80568/m.207367 type:complete len:250 (+) Transcript_80568:99-848(+)
MDSGSPNWQGVIQRVPSTLLVQVCPLERVVAHPLGAIGAPVPIRAVAASVAQQTVVQYALQAVHLGQAALEEVALAPEPEGQLLHALLRLVPAGAPREVVFEGCDRMTGHHLEGPAQAVVAVVDEPGVSVVQQDSLKSLREEHRVRIHLDCPVIGAVLAIVNDLLPDGDGDPGAQLRRRVSEHGLHGLEGAAHEAGGHARRHIQRLVAVHSVPVAAEDAAALGVLHGQQLRLVPEGPHKREAEQRGRAG